MDRKARRPRDERGHRERLKHEEYMRRMIELELEEEELAYRERLYYEDYLYRARMYEMYEHDLPYTRYEEEPYRRYEEEFPGPERMLPRDISPPRRMYDYEEDPRRHEIERTYGPEWENRWRHPDEREQMTERFPMVAESWNTYREGGMAAPGPERYGGGPGPEGYGGGPGPERYGGGPGPEGYGGGPGPERYIGGPPGPEGYIGGPGPEGYGGYPRMLTENKEDKYTDEEKVVFKMKHSAAIPYCYFGTFFDKRFNEFTVQVHPVSHADLCLPGFMGIKTRAASFKFKLNPKVEASSEQNTLEILVDSEEVRYIMAATLKLKYSQPHVHVTLSQRKAVNEAPVKKPVLPDTEQPPRLLSSIVNTVSFRMNTTHFVNHRCNEDNSSDNQSSVYLRNLPISVNTTFLRILFPLCQKTQLAAGESGSAIVQMCCPKMAIYHVASITCLQINGQAIQMKSEVPPHAAVQMLRESQENPVMQPVDMEFVPKKRKKLSPSDIRRNNRKIEERRQRQMAQFYSLPHAPPFPGIPSLLSMSFPGPGNAPAQWAGQKTYPSSGQSTAFSGRGGYRGGAANTSFGGANKGPGANSMVIATGTDDEFPIIPIPQLLEGPYHDPNEDTTQEGSKKVRTKCYFRRRASRVAVHYAHMWGEDLKAISKALAHSAAGGETMVAPASKFSAKQLTEKTLVALRLQTKEKPSMDEMRKAEDHWQKKRKEREAAGKFVPQEMQEEEIKLSKMKTPSQIQRDKVRMTQFNQKVSTLAEDSGTANTGQSHAPTPVQANNSNSFKSGGASSPTGGWPTKQSGWNSTPAQQQYGAYPPAPKPTPPPPSPGSYQQGQYKQKQNQQGQNQGQNQGQYKQGQGQYQQGQYKQHNQGQNQGQYQQGQYKQHNQGQNQGQYKQKQYQQGQNQGQNQGQYQQGQGQYQQGQYKQKQNQQGQNQGQYQGQYEQGQNQGQYQGQEYQGQYQGQEYQGQYQGQEYQGQNKQGQDPSWQQSSQQSTFRYPPPPPSNPARANQNRAPQPPAPRSAQPNKRFPSPSPSPPPEPNRKRFFSNPDTTSAQPSQNRYSNPPSDAAQTQYPRPQAPAHKAQDDFKFTRPPPPGPLIQAPQNQSTRFQQPNSAQASYPPAPPAPTPPPPNQYSYPPPPSPSATPPPYQAQNPSSWQNTTDSSYWEQQGYGSQEANQQVNVSSGNQQSDPSQSGWGSEYAGAAGYDQSAWGSYGNQQQY